MQDEARTKEQLTNELVEMLRQTAELEALETERRQALLNGESINRPHRQDHFRPLLTSSCSANVILHGAGDNREIEMDIK